MIEIEFNLNLVERVGKKSQTLDIGKSLRMSELEARLGLTEDDVGMLLINNAWAPLDSVIKDGDQIKLYPFLEGG
jgi:molybdopterin converting factor small subunit